MGFRIKCTRLSFNCVCFCCTKNNQTISNIIHPFLGSGDKKIIQIIINNNHDQKTKIAGVFMVIMTSLTSMTFFFSLHMPNGLIWSTHTQKTPVKSCFGGTYLCLHLYLWHLSTCHFRVKSERTADKKRQNKAQWLD